MPSRFAIYAKGRDLAARAQRVMEFSVAGPGCDLARAQRELDAMRAILGPDGE
jgi:hypothetical protein